MEAVEPSNMSQSRSSRSSSAGSVSLTPSQSDECATPTSQSPSGRGPTTITRATSNVGVSAAAGWRARDARVHWGGKARRRPYGARWLRCGSSWLSPHTPSQLHSSKLAHCGHASCQPRAVQWQSTAYSAGGGGGVHRGSGDDCLGKYAGTRFSSDLQCSEGRDPGLGVLHVGRAQYPRLCSKARAS